MAKKKQNGKVFDLLKTLEPGNSFYVETEPRVALSYAHSFGIKITTCNVLIVEEVNKEQPIIKKITKVTLI